MDLKIRKRPSSSFKEKGNPRLLKNHNDSWHCPNSKKNPFSPNPSGRATLTKKARAVGERSITFNERGWKFRCDIQALRTAIVFCLKRRLGRSRMDRVQIFCLK
ncbi:hypothetical protein AVEN_208066-1 [Araneus ventricosus]|uniref:Uncharacterized protein n=1 Tax=Araneus ventricosus TaxID=182803 RepID=A0A4Y2XE98_ARAVE|nr:hypothetical protein AVEN_208066-1 [Araneus ventricosus]